LLQLSQRNVQHRPARENYCSFDEVLQFPYVSGPAIASQGGNYLSGNPLYWFPHPFCKLLSEEVHQQRNVVSAFAQWRQRDREYVQTVKEITPELLFGYQLRQVSVGSSHDANVNRHRPRTAKPFEFLFLKDTQ
jgi:hypothetical protein